MIKKSFFLLSGLHFRSLFDNMARQSLHRFFSYFLVVRLINGIIFVCDLDIIVGRQDSISLSIILEKFQSHKISEGEILLWNIQARKSCGIFMKNSLQKLFLMQKIMSIFYLINQFFPVITAAIKKSFKTQKLMELS